MTTTRTAAAAADNEDTSTVMTFESIGNNNNGNDDATQTTVATESFAQVRGGGTPLTMTAAPLYSVIGTKVLERQRRGGGACHHSKNHLTGGAVAPSPRCSNNKNNSSSQNAVMTTTDLCITLKAGELPESEEERAPVDILVALDLSASMDCRSKVDLCRSTLKVLMRQLLPQDRFGLVTYSTEARIAIPLQKMSTEHKESACKVMDTFLRANGNTNLSSALGLAAQEMRTSIFPPESKNPVQTIFFLTDGHANEGITETSGLVKLVRNCLLESGQINQQEPKVIFDPEFIHVMSLDDSNTTTAVEAPIAGIAKKPFATTDASKHQPGSPSSLAGPAISLHMFGYGADHNGTLLREMASATQDGSYYFIEEDKDVGRAFGDALGGVLSVVAQTATVTLSVPPLAQAMGVEIVQVKHDQVVRRENGSFTVTMGDFYAEETRDLVVTVKLAVPTPPPPPTNGTNTDPPQGVPIPHLSATLSYTDTLESKLVQQGDTVQVSIARPLDSTVLSEENAHVATQVFRVHAASAMEQAEKLAAAGRYREAKATFTLLKRAYWEDCSAAVQATPQSAALFHDASTMEWCLAEGDDGRYSSWGQANLNTKLCAHKMQRSSTSTAAVVAMPASTTGDPATAAAVATFDDALAYKSSPKRASYAAKFSTTGTI
ncbi:hypothetical protein ACA910_013764 [Epithemia clementina (nom. ined.)]